MSDAYYRERAARRGRIIWLSIGAVLILACLYFSATRIFWDECTQSFQRNPERVVRSYVEAISEGDALQPRRCWVDSAYFNLETGCSEICISRLLGTPFEIQNIEISQAVETETGRAQITATVSVTCPGEEQPYTGELLLDSIRQNVPWQHWKIIESSFGGPMGELWCQ